MTGTSVMKHAKAPGALPAHVEVPPGMVLWPGSIILLNFEAAMSSCLLFLYLFARFALETGLPFVYGETFTNLGVKEQRSFICHHQWLLIKCICVGGAWPWSRVIFHNRPMAEALGRKSYVTNCDLLSVLYALIIAGFFFELLYRLEISPVSTIHHAAAILLTIWLLCEQLTVVPLVDEPQPPMRQVLEADIQFRLIVLYGTFEVVFESWSNICAILHRIYRSNPRTLANIWGLGALYVLIGSLMELSVMIVFWVRYWRVWSLVYKIAMPLLHVAFMAAQIHGAGVGFKLRRRFLKEAQESDKQAAASTNLPIVETSPNSQGHRGLRTESLSPSTAAPTPEGTLPQEAGSMMQTSPALSALTSKATLARQGSTTESSVSRSRAVCSGRI